MPMRPSPHITCWAPCEAFSNLARFDSVRYGYCAEGHKDLGSQYEASRAAGFGMEAKRRIMVGSYLLSSGVYEKYYYPAQQVRTLITQDYQAAYEKCDVILAPTSPRTAFKFGEIGDPVEMHLSDIFTVSINIAGNGVRTCQWLSAATWGFRLRACFIARAQRREHV